MAQSSMANTERRATLTISLRAYLKKYNVNVVLIKKNPNSFDFTPLLLRDTNWRLAKETRTRTLLVRTGQRKPNHN